LIYFQPFYPQFRRRKNPKTLLSSLSFICPFVLKMSTKTQELFVHRSHFSMSGHDDARWWTGKLGSAENREAQFTFVVTWMFGVYFYGHLGTY